MMRAVLLFLGATGVVAAGQDLTFPRDPYRVRPLEFEVAVPEGWTADQDHTGMVARDRDRNGFQVSREPMLQDPRSFADAWAVQLVAGGKPAKVEAKKAGRYQAWRAAWRSDAAGGRAIEVWRVHVPEIEMLYSISFSAAPPFPLEPLVEAVLKSFRCVAEKAALRFQPTGETVTNRISIRLPEGYAKEPPRMGGLGGGLSAGYVKTLGGYPQPHEAGRVQLRQVDPRFAYQTPDGGSVAGTDAAGLLRVAWGEAAGELGEVVKKPKAKAARYAGLKGDALEAEVLTKEGLPKVWYGFCGKHRQDMVLITILVDQRETRLHKDLFRDMLGQLEVQE
jgi:hypothetical protein